MTFSSTPTRSPELESFAAALAGQYEIEREVGRGGMGLVYAARDIKLERRVAIKTLLPHLAGDPAMRERFLREARTAASLSHQSIAPVHRADEIDGRVFFVMGFVDGESMAHRIATRGPLHPTDVVAILRDVAAALGYAHDRGVIHRDIKAENILIERATGRAIVTDFGIARLSEASPLTATGQMLGTVHYSSPEQVSGDPIDQRSDIYSLGVVGFLALSGRFPFDAALASAVLIAHVNSPPPLLRTVAPGTPPELAAIVDQCLLKHPARRFQRCDDLLNALQTIAVSPAARAHATLDGTAPALVSDTEAQAIWQRAADLQAMTGVRPRPAPVSRPRDDDRDTTRTSGHQLTNVRDAALEAGIAEKYVEHAFAEHGLPSTVPVQPASRLVVDRSRGGAIAGGPTLLEYEIVVDGEMPAHDYDLLANIASRELSDPGRVSEIGRSFAWQSNPKKWIIHVVVTPRSGKTTIRVTENLNQWVAAIYVLTGCAGLLVTLPLHALALAAAPVISGCTTHVLFGALSRQRQKSIRRLAEALAAQVRESVDTEARMSAKHLPPRTS